MQWEQPRATATSYISVITFIFAARYLPLLRWVFKLAYVVLGCMWIPYLCVLGSVTDRG